MADHKLGFIGLGEMGKPMVRNLLKAGYAVTVWNRGQSGIDECVRFGAEAGRSAADVASKASIIITMVTGSDDVKSVVLGTGGIIYGAQPGATVVDMSTISPEVTKEIARALGEKDIGMLDAPVTGYDVGAIAGTLTIMVGGPEETFRKCLPVFSVLGENIVHVGTEAGSGHSAKLCNQILGAFGMLATCETFMLAKKLNLDAQKVFSVVKSGVACSPLLSRCGEAILKGDYETSAMIKKPDLNKKDFALVVEAAEAAGANLPGIALVKQIYDTIDAKGIKIKGILGLMNALESLQGES